MTYLYTMFMDVTIQEAKLATRQSPRTTIQVNLNDDPVEERAKSTHKDAASSIPGPSITFNP